MPILMTLPSSCLGAKLKTLCQTAGPFDLTLYAVREEHDMSNSSRSPVRDRELIRQAAGLGADRKELLEIKKTGKMFPVQAAKFLRSGRNKVPG